MRYSIFISYANSDQDIIENFRGELKLLGIEDAWAYSVDKTLTEDTWSEIERKIKESHLIIFVISKDTITSEGQKRELRIALSNGTTKVMPIFLDNDGPSECPEELKHINGEFLNSGSVKSTAHKIIKQVFPSLLTQRSTESWRYPRPGEWLIISNIDPRIEENLSIGDKLYFRSLSPNGLFECYSPKIKALLWIFPDNVAISDDCIDNNLQEDLIPYIYTVSGSINIQQRGWDDWNRIHID